MTRMTPASTSGSAPATGWVGWIAFAALMLMINGVMNAVSGLIALFNDNVYVQGSAGVAVLDLTAFGWIHLLLGLGVLASGAFLLTGVWWARLVAVAAVSLNVVTQMLLMPAYPYWSLLILAVDLLILWALLIHGDEMERIT